MDAPKHKHNLASINLILRSKGVQLSQLWLQQAIEYLHCPPSLNHDAIAEKVFGLYLDSDIYETTEDCSSGLLPRNMNLLHKQRLPRKPIVLQIEDIANVGLSAMIQSENKIEGIVTPNYHSRMLKMLLTDGKQQVVAIESKQIPYFNSALVGSKLVVQGAFVRRGALILSPQCAKLLEGGIENRIILTNQVQPRQLEHQIHQQHKQIPPLSQQQQQKQQQSLKTPQISQDKQISSHQKTTVALKGDICITELDDADQIIDLTSSPSELNRFRARNSSMIVADNCCDKSDISSADGNEMVIEELLTSPNTKDNVSTDDDKMDCLVPSPPASPSSLNISSLSTMEDLIKFSKINQLNNQRVRLRGRATGVKKIKINSQSKFSVIIFFDDGNSVEQVIVGANICERFLGITAVDFSRTLNTASKTEKKDIQTTYAKMFESFQGLFWATMNTSSILSNSEGNNMKIQSASSSSSSSSTSSLSSSGGKLVGKDECLPQIELVEFADA